ncbi:hypothetical protein [Streptomyces agglomeratus]|nr:hypothetical protein [Streptomyces agglomeratus]
MGRTAADGRAAGSGGGVFSSPGVRGLLVAMALPFSRSGLQDAITG